MDNQADKDMDEILTEIAELRALLIEPEQQTKDPDAEFAAKLFRDLIQKRIKYVVQ